MDLAEYLTMRPNLFAVTKKDLGNSDEVVPEFNNPSHFQMKSKVELLTDEAVIPRKTVSLPLDATFDVVVSKIFKKLNHISLAFSREYL